MKNFTTRISLIAMLVISAFVISSCGGSKKIDKDTAERTGGFHELTLPCADKGKSDKKFFRASSVGHSRDLATSREKALLMTKQRLATLINSTLKSVTERYANEMDAGQGGEFSQTFENLTRDVVKQQLSDVIIICEKTGQKDDGSYETYMAIEMDKDVILKGINAGISRDKKMEVLYDKERFKKTYEDEMTKMGGGN
ncbi:MAG: hypothetical protein KAG64_01725 [Bacteroidales bacterium]|nr:hypothetical protein [Bacteroidales bacterium]